MRFILVCSIAITSLVFGACQENVGQRSYFDPQPTGVVNDFEEILLDEEIAVLDSLISQFEERTTIEIVVVTLHEGHTSLEEFDDYTLDLANAWGVGKADADNGILIGVSASMRKVRIRNGYGIEDIISDQQTKVVIDSLMIPHFRKGQYFDGLYAGTEGMMELLE